MSRKVLNLHKYSDYSWHLWINRPNCTDLKLRVYEE